MRIFSRITLVAALFAAVLASTSMAQPPDRDRGNRDGGPGRADPVDPVDPADPVAGVGLKVDAVRRLR